MNWPDIPSAIFGGILGSIFAYLLKLYIDHALAKGRAKHDRIAGIRNNAAIKFREAFIQEIDFLKSGKEPNSSIDGTAYDVLTKALNKHRLAYETYRLELPKIRRSGFDKAWEDYLYPECKGGAGEFIDYADGDESKKRKLAHDKILNLFKYAEIG